MWENKTITIALFLVVTSEMWTPIAGQQKMKSANPFQMPPSTVTHMVECQQ